MENEIIYRVPRPRNPEHLLNWALNPATVRTIATVVGKAMEYFNGVDQANWQSGVSSTLNEINAKLDTVIIELRQMKVWFEEALITEQKAQLADDIESRRILVEQILGSYKVARPSVDEGDNRDRLLRMMDELSVSTFKMLNHGRYGFVQYQGVISAALTIMLVQHLLRNTVDISERINVANHVRAYLEQAVNPSEPKSIEAARNQLALEVGNQRNHVASFLDKWWLVGYKNPDNPFNGGGFTTWAELMVRGDPDGTFTCEHRANPLPRTGAVFPGIPYPYNLEPEPAIQAVLSVMKEKQANYFAAIRAEGLVRAHVEDIVAAIGALKFEA